MADPTIPTSLRIGAYTYTVHSTPEAWRELKADSAQAHEAWGYSDVAKAAMWVDTENHDQQHVRDTVLHEVLHQCLHSTGRATVEHDDEEALVAAMSPTLLAALRDNPELVAYLTG